MTEQEVRDGFSKLKSAIDGNDEETIKAVILDLFEGAAANLAAIAAKSRG